MPRAREDRGRIVVGEPHDELARMVDDAFRGTTSQEAGPVDVLLIIAGLGLSASSIVLGPAGAPLWVGVAVFLLGVALPARAGMLRWSAHRQHAAAPARVEGALEAGDDARP